MRLTEEQKQRATAHQTDDDLWAAILQVAGEKHKAVERIWNDPTDDDIRAIEQVLREDGWRDGSILYWGESSLRIGESSDTATTQQGGTT